MRSNKNAICFLALFLFLMALSSGCGKSAGPGVSSPTPTPTCAPIGCADFIITSMKFTGISNQTVDGQSWMVYEYVAPIPLASFQATAVATIPPRSTNTPKPNIYTPTNTPVPFCPWGNCPWLNFGECVCKETTTPVPLPSFTPANTVCITTTGTPVSICGTPTPVCTVCDVWIVVCISGHVCDPRPTNTPKPWCTPGACNSSCVCTLTPSTPVPVSTCTPEPLVPADTPVPTPPFVMLNQGYVNFKVEAMAGWQDNSGFLDTAPDFNIYKTYFPTRSDNETDSWRMGYNGLYSCNGDSTVTRPTPSPFATPKILCNGSSGYVFEGERFYDGDVLYFRASITERYNTVGTTERPCKRMEDRMLKITGLNPAAYAAIPAISYTPVSLPCVPVENTPTTIPTIATPPTPPTPATSVTVGITVVVTPAFTIVIDATAVSEDENFISDTELTINYTIVGTPPPTADYDIKVVSDQKTDTLMMSAEPTGLVVDKTAQTIKFKPQATGSSTEGSLNDPKGLQYKIEIDYLGSLVAFYIIKQDDINRARQEYKWFSENHVLIGTATPVGTATPLGSATPTGSPTATPSDSYGMNVPVRADFSTPVDARLHVGNTSHYPADKFLNRQLTTINNAIIAISTFASAAYSCSWRSPYVNHDPSVGSKWNSPHLKGKAVDCPQPRGVAETPVNFQTDWSSIIGCAEYVLLEQGGTMYRYHDAGTDKWYLLPQSNAYYDGIRTWGYIPSGTIELGFQSATHFHLDNDR